MLDAGLYDMEDFKAGGWITDLKYEDEIEDMLKPKTGERAGWATVCSRMGHPEQGQRAGVEAQG